MAREYVRPELTGEEIMRILGLRPGPLVSRAWKYLIGLQIEHGKLGRERATAELLAWGEREGIAPPGSSSS